MIEEKGSYRQFIGDDVTLVQSWKLSRDHSSEVGKRNLSVENKSMERKHTTGSDEVYENMESKEEN